MGLLNCTLAFLLICLWGKLHAKPHSIFFSVYAASTFYFGIAGPAYWLIAMDGVFLGRDWRNELAWISWVFIAAFFLVTLVLTKNRPPRPQPPRPDLSARSAAFESFLFWGGWCAAGYVLTRLSDFELRDSSARNPILLIAYQFSDVLIPLILLKVARRPRALPGYAYLTLFLFYSILLGYRYKTLLLLAPVVVLFIFHQRRFIVRRTLVAATTILALLTFFSYMTLARGKFSGVDLSLLGSITADELLYGFFAESNIVFGLLSIMAVFSSFDEWVWLDPLLSTIMEYIPRALYPNKIVYSYILPIYEGLGGGGDAYSSGTAYPYFGEYYMMAGWAGFVVGVLFYVYLYKMLSRILLRKALDSNIALVGTALLSMVFGYYYFSRGFTPQASKAVLFIVLPYILLCARMRLPRRFS